jgi:uncharacterized membrane protein YphA (DoxX/SURF4 family)
VTSRAENLLSHPALGAACRLLLGGLFIYTAISKLFDPADFARFIAAYRLLHPDLVNLAAITLPWIELTAGALLVLGVWPQSAALVIAGMLGLFLGAGFLAVVRGMQIECGCFLPFLGSDELDWTFFVRDAAMLLPAAQVWLWPSSFLPGRR